MKSITKKLFIAVLTLGLALIASVGSTYAWFSMNKTVTASGMKVKAVAEGSIVITSTSSLPATGTKATDYNFADSSATALYASTHDADYATYSTGLKHVSNAENVNPETGVAKNSTASLSYEVATNGDKVYYKDYSIYLAGDGQEFTGQDITVTLSGSFATAANTINKAIAVDFYGVANAVAAATCISANYLGTLNVAGTKNNGTTNGTTASTSFVISNITIPATGSNKAYAITMRVYFDGALIETGGTNSYTAYEACGESDVAEAGAYYYNNSTGSSVVTVATGASVSGYYKVKTADSTFTYARTTKVALIEDVTLTATFVASAHTA